MTRRPGLASLPALITFGVPSSEPAWVSWTSVSVLFWCSSMNFPRVRYSGSIFRCNMSAERLLLALLRFVRIDLLDIDVGTPRRCLHRLFPLGGRLAQRDLFDDVGLLADHCFLGRFGEFNRLLLKGLLGFFRAQLAIRAVLLD